MATTIQAPEASPAGPARGSRIGLVVATSILSGLLLALILAVIIFGGGPENTITGVVLLAFALGWALLGALSGRTGQPQRWAYVPAVCMAALALAHLVFRPSDGVLRAFGWVWPLGLLLLVVWMVRQSRRRLGNWSRPAVLYPVFAVLVLAAVGGAFQAVAETRSYSMPGQLVDVGGHKLHISCTGSGSPAVVLEAGLGEPAVMMSGWIQPAVATSTKVCVYDRAGRGFSENGPVAQDGETIATDLHTLLARAHIAGPYVLAGHSSGGVYIKVFAAKYPDQVAGMVLLDAQPSDDFAKLPGYANFYEGLRRAAGLGPPLARLGVMRVFYATAVAGLPPKARAEERSDWPTARHYRSLREEVIGLKPALTQSQALTSLGAKPLIVVTAVKEAPPGWMPLQDEMMTLSTNSIHRVLVSATHTSLTEDKTEAGESSQAIIDVVSAVRSGAALA